MRLPGELKKYFWEVDTEKLDFKKRGEYVIGRLLECGDVEAIRWLFKTFDRELIKKVILKSRGFSPKTLSFWSPFLVLIKNKSYV